MYVCVYVYKYSVDVCMIKFRVRRCSMWRMLLSCGKFIGLLLFCLLLFLLSILILKSDVRNIKKFKE